MCLIKQIKMKKLQKATKRIAAVASAATLTAASVFGAGLGDYPNNFVANGAFDGQVVVGASANALDTTSATSIIDDLRDTFSGASEQVQITYRTSASGGEQIEFADSGNTWNYGEFNQAVRTTSFDESDDEDVFSDDETFDNGFSDEDYTQELEFLSGAMLFEHALRDDQSDEISTHLYLEDTDLAIYTFELDSALPDIDDAEDNDFVGEDIEILGQIFTITEVGRDGGGSGSGLDKLVMIGGANKVALGEGDSTEVTLDGQSFEIEVQAVGSSEVLISVNGVAKSVDEFDTDVINGLNIGVTELIESSRDSVKGYAELVLGGNEVELEDGQQIKLNDVDIDDIYDELTATVVFNGSSDQWEGFQVTYTLDDEVLLEEGEALEDFVFGAWSIMFDGTNDVDYEVIELSVSSDKLSVDGNLDNGDSFSEDIAMLVDEDADSLASSGVVLIGNSDDDIMLVSDFANTSVTFTGDASFNPLVGINYTVAGFTANGGASVTAPTNGNTVDVGNFVVRNVSGVYHASLNLDEADGFRFLVGDADDQYLWEVGQYSSGNDEVDFEDLLQSTNENDINTDEIGSKLDEVTATGDNGVVGTISGTFGYFAFANEALIGLSNVPSNSSTSLVEFVLDNGDVDADNEPGDLVASAFNISLGLDLDDDEFNLGLTTSDFELASGAEADVSDSDDDNQEYVNKYGVMVEYDSEEDRTVRIHVPDEQIEAMVYLVTGSGVSQTLTVTVDADSVDEKIEELEDDGYTIVDTETLSSEEVEFDIDAPVLDSDVVGDSDMIVVGGPAVNSVAADLLGLAYPTFGSASGVNSGEAVIRYFETANAVLVYGFDAADTAAAAEQLNEGGLTGTLVNVQ